MTDSSRIYLDHAATTPTAPEVLEAMLPYFGEHGYNPSGLYAEARKARAAVDGARETLAEVFGCSTEEVVFTGSGSEGANLAVKGAALAQRLEGRDRVAVSAVEHYAVLNAARFLQRHLGFKLDLIPVDSEGGVHPGAVERILGDDLAVVSVQYANNEVGTIQPIREIAATVRDSGAIVHTDAVQAAGALSLDVDELGVDLLSIAAHKFYGPKGVGALYVRKGTRLIPQVHGGAQERNRRAGTENVALIVGMAVALAMTVGRREQDNQRNGKLSAQVRAGLKDLEGVRFNGPRDRRLPNNTNVCIEGVNAEGMLLQLDRAGIAASSGSACTSASLEPSHVLLAMGVPPEIARGSLRITTGRCNDEHQIARFLDALFPIVERLRGVASVAS